MTTETLYSSDTARVIVQKDADLNARAYLDIPADYPLASEFGVVDYYVERLVDGEWTTDAVFAAPMFDQRLRSEAATAALQAAD